MIGTVTPTIRPISGANIPPALTTTSARISRAFALVLDGHAGHPAAIRADRDDPRVRPDLRAALARAGGQRVGEPGRVEPAVGRQPDGAQDAVGRHEREAVLRLLAP